MQKLGRLLSTASAVLVFAAGAAGADEMAGGPGGAITLYGGAGAIDLGADWYALGGFNAAVLMPMGGFQLQIGGVGEIGWETGGADTYNGVGFELHALAGRDGMMFGLGTTLLLDQSDDHWNIHGAVALEGGVTRGAMGFGFQLGYLGTLATEGDERLQNALWVRAGAGYGFGPVMISAEVGFYRGMMDPDDTGLDLFRALGAGAEVAFNLRGGMQVFVAWDGFWHQNVTEVLSYATHQFTGGIRLMLGGTPPAADMPNFTRINAILAENS